MLGGGQVCRGGAPVHRDGPALVVRGGGDGPLHAQGDRGDLRGGPAAAETDGAAAPVRARLQADDRCSDEHGPESCHGTVCY